MLPDRLSCDLSSLNENEDRLAVVVEFDVGPDGALGTASVYRAAVRNQAKLTYESVGLWLEGKGPEPPEIAASPALREQLHIQDEAAQQLRRARSIAGALDFESVEARPVVAHGKVVDLAVVRRNRARDMIASHGSLPVPRKLRNPVTRLMKDEGYGEGYRYPHDFADGVAPGEAYLPDEIADRRWRC